MQISTSGKHLVLRASLNGALMEQIRAMPGFKKWAGRDLLFEPTGANLEYVRKSWPHAVWDPSAVEHWERFERKKDLVGSRAINFEFRTEPFKHQREVFNRSAERESFAYFMEMGTGKTKVILDVAAYNYSRGLIDSVLIVAPNGVHRNWINNEAPKHIPIWCPHVGIAWQSTVTATFRKRLEAMWEEDTKLRLFAINVEALSTRRGTEIAKRFLITCKAMMVVDESSTIKTPGAKRTQSAVSLGKHAVMRRIANGTPITKGLEDLFSQLKFLDEDILGYSSFYTFRAHFCVMGGFEMKQIVGYQNVEEFQRLLEPHSYRVLKRDCLDLPPKLYVRHPVEITDKQKQMYDQIKEDFITEFADIRVSMPLAITRLLRGQQVVCGHISDGPDKFEYIVEPSKNPRIRAVLEICNQAEGKVIIWSRFIPDILAIAEEMRKEFGDGAIVTYHGGVSGDKREEAIRLFQTEGGPVRFFVGQQRSGGRGIELFAASTVVYYSNDFSLEVRLQSEDRAHRFGQRNAVTYIDLEAESTIDTKILKALSAKKDFADFVNKDEPTEWL